MAACKMKQLESNKINKLAYEKCSTEIFQSEADMSKNLKHLCYLDLYVIGRLYTETLKKVLTGSKMDLFPTLYAAQETETPKRPTKMKYSELPLYPLCPHFENKDWLEKCSECTSSDINLLNEALLPTVKQVRLATQNLVTGIVTEVTGTYKEVSTDVGNTVRDIKGYFRSPQREMERRAVVALGGLTGLFLARKRGIPSKIFFSSLGLLATGALCFPKETDQYFRACLFHASRNVQSLFNCWCNGNFSLRECVPRERDLSQKVERPSQGNQCKGT